MKLYIPEQSEPEKGAFPSHPRKVKKWLTTIPQANMGEMTRQIFRAVRELNRQTMPYKHRLEVMEMMRLPSRQIFNNLKKYFVNRTLPLPDKSKKIINLNQSLLQEMAHGYKIIIYEAANGIGKKVDTKTQAIACCRAMTYQSEMLLRASEVYDNVPLGTWFDLHQMHAYAHTTNLQKVTVTDTEHPNSKSCVMDIYRQVLLFALARPTAMRQSDTERVYNKLYQWSSLAILTGQPDISQINHAFCARINEDRPPSYVNQEDCEANDVFTLDTSVLIENIQNIIRTEEQKQDSFTVGDEISADTLKLLSISWGKVPKRKFSRADRKGHIAVAIGISQAASMIREFNRPPDDEATTSIEDGNFTLETLPDETRGKDNGYVTHSEIGNSSSNPWDMVAKGNVMTNSYAREQEKKETGEFKLNTEHDHLHWEIVNISAGGYCLRWNSDNTSKAQIGELIALREREPDGSHEWRIGAIRWMQFTRENGLEIGVQVLSPKVIAAEVNRRNRPNDVPFDSLMVPGIRPLKQPATIILPAHAFKTEDKLKVHVFGQDMQVALGKRVEHTGSFSQFQFLNLKHDGSVKQTSKQKTEVKKKDDFDEIWSSL